MLWNAYISARASKRYFTFPEFVVESSYHNMREAVTLAKGKCPKCGSTDISYQVVQTESVSRTKGSTTVNTKSGGGCLWSLVMLPVKIAMVPIKFLLALPLMFLPGHRKKAKVAEHTATTTTKTKNETKAVCQNCGHTWNV